MNPQTNVGLPLGGRPFFPWGGPATSAGPTPSAID
jgi:hypothetical protein